MIVASMRIHNALTGKYGFDRAPMVTLKLEKLKLIGKEIVSDKIVLCQNKYILSHTY